MEPKASLDVSVVVPVLNEQDSIIELCHRVHAELERLGRSHEILVIDDGSTDETVPRVQALGTELEELVLLRCRRNFGKATALNVGFKSSRGKILITMDGDLQDDPNELPNMIRKIEEGWDLVSGWKKERHDPLGKRLPSKLFNACTARMSGVALHDFNCGFKAYRRQLVDCLDLYGEMHRYIPALAHWMGFTVTEIPVKHHPRTTGKSKYGIERFTRGWFDFLTIAFITKFNGKPMHFFGKFGTIFLGVGGLGCSYLAYLWFCREFLGHDIGAIGTRPLLQVSIFFVVVSLLFYATGLLAELMFHLTRPPQLRRHLLIETDHSGHR